MTKNLLLGSTALVGAIAMAAPAFADIEVTLSGQVEFGAEVFDDEAGSNGRGYFFFMDSETKIQAEGAADNGVNYSAKVELETDADRGAEANDTDDDDQLDDFSDGEVNADEAVLAFWGGFGRVELGREDGAADNMFIGGEDFQAGTGGIDGDGINLNINLVDDSGDAAKITYFSPRLGGFQVGASFTPDVGDDQDDSDVEGDIEEHWELGANYTLSAGGADVTLTGVASIGDNEVAGEDDLEDYGIGAGVEFAGLGLGIGYAFREEADEGNGLTLGAKYGFGPASVSLGFSHDDPDEGDKSNVYVASADYGLFPGVKLKGDLSYNDDDSDADGESTTAGVVSIQVDY